MQITHRDMQKTLLQSELLEDNRMEYGQFEETCQHMREVIEHDHVVRMQKESKAGGECVLCQSAGGKYQPISKKREQEVESMRDTLKSDGFNPFH